ncbi:tetratricopeptide repeat protein [Sandaracinus amylolyticus]|uniref:tetratricopeptide repeat protein n=1 Tax=Sandaracinus amylolyticus TaxID=927083 RepID=UPI001F458C93|nr:tetratricopeptide repeat protein [Sandaracinus amylolyticus]
MAVLSALLALAPMTVGPRRAHAQDSAPLGQATELATSVAAPPRDTPREAIELFQRAREHYQHGRYEAAATDLEQALAIDPESPTLLYNLGRVYELWGEHDRAIATYERYLRVIPPDDAAERERTEAAVQRLRGARSYVRPDEEIYSRPIYVSQRGVDDELFWATLTAGAVITVGAVGLALAMVLVRDDATRFQIGADGELSDLDARFETVDTLALTTDIVGAVGGVTLLSAGLLWLLRERTVELYPSSAPLRVDVSADPRGGGGLAVRGAF